ncbi:TonB-dependent receptor [candidate division KSB1 bacterium]|nr:MAG: TonB-dependent receptor [candidate division KSB1 bacterium]
MIERKTRMRKKKTAIAGRETDNGAIRSGKHLMACLSICFFILALFAAPSFAFENPVGSLSGQVLDAETKEPLMGAAIMLAGTQFGTATDGDGRFTIEQIPAGNYTVTCSYVGYLPALITDVIVKTRSQSPLKIELTVSAIETREVTITPSAFSNIEREPVAVTSLSYEEIRRHPNSAGDVSRIIMALPSVAKVNDTETALVVRGGSTLENGFYVDGIPVPNINHFPAQGASSGAMSLINIDFIEDVQFMAGGFSARYGDRMSSVTDITLREGTRNGLKGQLDFDMTGFGGGLEGSLPGKKGSWMLAAHRSYFDLVVDLFDIEASTTPYYTDVATKLTFDASPRHRFTLLDIAGFDVSRIKRQQAIDNKEGDYGRGNWNVNTFGIGWRYLYGKRGYCETTLSHNITSWDSEWRTTKDDEILNAAKTTEQKFTLKNDQHLLFNKRTALDLGGEAVYQEEDIGNYWGETLDPLGNLVPAIHVSRNISSPVIGGYVSLRRDWLPRFTTTLGVRADYSDYTSRATVSPRAQLSFRLNEKTAVSGAYGRYYQQLPLILLSQKDEFKKLDDPYADHYVVSASHLLTENTRLTVEAYDKEYGRMPLNPLQPSLFVMDQIAHGDEAQEQLTNNGEAWTRGVEVMVQKKLVDKVFGVVSGSIFRTRYQGFDGTWRDRSYDNRWMFTIEGGYKPNRNWEYSLRFVYAGGAPFTPFDHAASYAAEEGIRDSLRVNAERLPDYHTLNVRVDRRFHFRSSDLICYLNIWNIYNRENIAGYYWSPVENRQKTSYQWGILPVIGIEFEF